MYVLFNTRRVYVVMLILIFTVLIIFWQKINWNVIEKWDERPIINEKFFVWATGEYKQPNCFLSFCSLKCFFTEDFQWRYLSCIIYWTHIKWFMWRLTHYMNALLMVNLGQCSLGFSNDLKLYYFFKVLP